MLRTALLTGLMATLLAVGFAGCDDDAGSDRVSPELASTKTGLQPPGSEVDYIFDPRYDTRLAWQHPTLRSLKGDWADDIRFAAPENYAITVPPANLEHVRAMVEWEPMQAVIVPVPGGFDDNYWDNAMGTIIGIVKHSVVDAGADAWVLTPSQAMEDFVTAELIANGVPSFLVQSRVKYLHTPLDSVWLIDYGPLPIVDKQANTFAFSDFRYYRERPTDDGVPTILGRSLPQLGLANNTDTYRLPINTEGGTFQTTTDGICITGDRQLVNQTCELGACQWSIENLSMTQLQQHTQADVIREAWARVGCKDVIILKSITDDGTGHIDMYVKILDDQRVMIGDYETPYANTAQQTNATRMDQNVAFLEAYTKPDGTHFQTERLVMPGHRTTSGYQIPFTYINSTMITGPSGSVNIWPATNYANWEASRAKAEGQWQAALPGWTHVWVDATQLSFQSGAIHCISRTVPDLEPGLWVGDGDCEGQLCAAPEGGYSGACAPVGGAGDICWGPQWECACAHCESGCDYTPAADECMGLTFEGCCDDTTSIWCEGGELKQAQCGGGGCGWNAGQAYYDCDQSGADPSGGFPRACGEVLCEPDCGGAECGDNGCGGVCGVCPLGDVCNSGLCGAPQPIEDAGPTDQDATSGDTTPGDTGTEDTGVEDTGPAPDDTVEPPDVPGQPDVVISEDVPATPDVPVPPDVPAALDVPATPDAPTTDKGGPQLDGGPGTTDGAVTTVDTTIASDTVSATDGGTSGAESDGCTTGQGRTAPLLWLTLATVLLLAARRRRSYSDSNAA